MNPHKQSRLPNNGFIGEGIKFERIRRITGYLTGTVERWNGAKQAELNDRVKHMSNPADLVASNTPPTLEQL